MEESTEKLKVRYQKQLLKQYFGPNIDQLNVIFRSMRVTRQLYFNEFAGNHVRKILMKTHCFETLDAYENHDIVKQTVTTLNLLGNIPNYTYTDFSENEDMVKLKDVLNNFKDHLAKHFPKESVYPKLYILWNHFLDSATKSGFFFTEQDVESINHIFKTNLLPRVSFLRGSDHLKWMIIQHYIANCL